MYNHFIAIFSGAIFVIAIIAGIGPQNLNTLTHAIRRNYPYTVASTCFLADSVLILLASIGLSLTNSKVIIFIINIIGIFFISWYLLQKVRGLFQKHSKFTIAKKILTKKQSILQALALTWLNPLVFMDTVVVIGGTAIQYSGLNRVDFILGALVGDFIWLFGLTAIAASLSHRLNRTSIWLTLDVITITIMIVILYKTIRFVV